MKTGQAAMFANCLMTYQMEKHQPRYGLWTTFRAAFVDAFCSLNESTMAIVQLKSEGYFHGKKSVDEYIDEFGE